MGAKKCEKSTDKLIENYTDRCNLPNLDNFTSILQNGKQIQVLDSIIVSLIMDTIYVQNVISGVSYQSTDFHSAHQVLLQQVEDLSTPPSSEDILAMKQLVKHQQRERVRGNRKIVLDKLREMVNNREGINIKLVTKQFSPLRATFYGITHIQCEGENYNSLRQIIMSRIPQNIIRRVSIYTVFSWSYYENWWVEDTDLRLRDVLSGRRKK